MAAHKKDIIVANWRFANEMDKEEVKKVFKAFKELYRNDKSIQGLTNDDFIKAYLNKNDQF